VRKLLSLAVEPIKQGAQLEIDSLLQKRQRFLEEARYAYRQALSNTEGDKYGSHVGGDTIKEDAEAYAKWCSQEIARILRARELRCEERWKLCLGATDGMGRTPLMYACCEMGGDDAVKVMLTVGRANLSASCPKGVDVEAFMNGASIDYHQGRDAKGRVKGNAKGKKGAFSSNLRFVPAPCNTSKFTAMAVLQATLNMDDSSNRDPLFPREEQFHFKTGQVKARKGGGKGSADKKMTQLSSKFSKAGTSDSDMDKEYRGGDPAGWLCGRLLHAVMKKKGRKIGPKQRLTQLFQRHDEVRQRQRA